MGSYRHYIYYLHPKSSLHLLSTPKIILTFIIYTQNHPYIYYLHQDISLTVHLSICLSVTFRVRAITNVCILLGTNVVLIETMCSDLDPDPHIKGQGHTIH